MSEKPKINYPTTWSYKIIARSEEGIRTAIQELDHPAEITLKVSNSSAKGTFTSMDCTTCVENEEERLSIYKQLKKHSTIKMVL